MILDYLNKDYAQIILEFQIVFLCWVAVAIAVGLDLHFGIKKSKQVGDYTNSYGIRKTFEKATYYYALMVIFLLADMFNPFGMYVEIFQLPVMTIAMMFALLFTELLSIREKADQKQRRMVDKSAKQLLDIILKNKELIEEFKSKKEGE
ncbi:phage holin family protein [Faecalibacter sp. LW9]|uniref:phage holin family protein n=1 Tax=Faecalibacter sp. LW9 TaxID=3103144 RepID=UPI002AFE044E|nr:phage holin family protein [Faecalibacter sp. LW9]